MAPKELSAFERRRLENIATNRALLTDISTTTAKIAKPSRPVSKPKRRAPGHKKEPVETPTRVTRQSSRIKGLAADDTSLKRKYEAAIGAADEREREKRTRLTGDLQLADISIDGSKWDGGVGSLKGLQLQGAQPGVRTWDALDVKEEDDEDGGEERDREDGEAKGTEPGVKALRRRLNKLTLYEKWAPNGELVLSAFDWHR